MSGENHTIKSQATMDDWAWFSATGRAFRVRKLNDIERTNFNPLANSAGKYRSVVVRRSDGAAVIVSHNSVQELDNYTDDQLKRFSSILNLVADVDPSAE